VGAISAMALIAMTGVVAWAQDEEELPASKRAAKATETAKPAAPAKAEPADPATEKAAAKAEPPEAATEKTPAAAAPARVEPPAPVRTQVGTYTVESSGPWTTAERLRPRPPELWQVFMHGVIDHFAKPAAWDDLLSKEQPAETWLDKDWLLQGNPFRSSTVPSLKLGPGQVLVTGKPLVPAERLRDLPGKTVRVFVWMSGKDTGQGRYLWDAVPRADVLLTDGTGKVVSSWQGLMATRGTFPWRCYYRDITLPDPARPVAELVTTDVGDGLARTRGVYLRLTNPASGTAWFSTPSWEVVGLANTYAPGDLQDPFTGSMAPNPWYDELPVHLASPSVRYRGTDPAYAWAFLGGRARGAANVADVTTKAGLEAYLKMVAANDPHHLVHGMARLPEWLHAGLVFKCLPPTEPDLLAFLGERVRAGQDAQTGFWGYAQAPQSMAATAAIVERAFGGSAFKRADKTATVQAWLTCGEAPLANTEAIAKTVLGLQATADEAKRTKGGWTGTAMTSADTALVAMDRNCSLAATADAVFLLRRCAEGQSPALQTRCERAVREAVEHVWATCLQPSGLWKQSEGDLAPTMGGVMARLIEASPLLEFRVSPQIRAPQVPEAVTPADGVVRIAWTAPGEEAVSLRLYVAPEGVTADKLGDQYLAGVLCKADGEDVRVLDPMVTVLAMRRQGRLQWGPAGFDEGGYTAAKLKGLPDPLPTTMKGEPLAVALPRDKAVALYACAANAYGEVSRPVVIAIKSAGKAPEATAPAATPGEVAPKPETTPAVPPAEATKPAEGDGTAPAAAPAEKAGEEPGGAR